MFKEIMMLWEFRLWWMEGSVGWHQAVLLCGGFASLGQQLVASALLIADRHWLPFPDINEPELELLSKSP